jgi:hypothetical protein
MKPGKISINVLLITVIIGCNLSGKRPNQNLIAERDTLLKKAIIQEFPMFFQRKYQFDEVNTQIELCNANYNEIIVNPGKFKLQYYQIGNPFHYSPFAIKVTDSVNNILKFFTFNDELHYLYNDLNGSYWYGDSIEIRSRENIHGTYIDDLNLEKNVNEMIEKLGYQNNQTHIINLLEVIFVSLLDMEQVNMYELNHLCDQLKTVRNRNTEIDNCIREFENFRVNFHVCDLGLCVKAKEGLFGFWQFTLEEQGLGYKVKVRFIGDLIYNSMYM